MQKEMIFEIRVFWKASGTDATFEGPWTRMYVHMRFEIAGCWEGFWTKCTLVWFFLNTQLFFFKREEDKKIKLVWMANILCFNYILNQSILIFILSVCFDLHIYGLEMTTPLSVWLWSICKFILDQVEFQIEIYESVDL